MGFSGRFNNRSAAGRSLNSSNTSITTGGQTPSRPSLRNSSAIGSRQSSHMSSHLSGGGGGSSVGGLSGVGGGGGMSGGYVDPYASDPSNNMSIPKPTLFQRYCRCCVDFRDTRAAYFLMRTLRSRFWKTLMIIFSLYLLFGSQIQHLWITPDGDVLFDIMSFVTLGFFIADMIIRIIVEPKYFNFQLTTPSNIVEPSKEWLVGSFMFLCDLASTTAALWEISYINRRHFEFQEVNIELNESGVPNSGFAQNRMRPVSVEFDLLVTVARCARCARFVRSRTLVNASNKINWYWVFNQLLWLNPFYYWKKIRKQRRQAHLASLGVTGEDSSAFVSQTNREDKRSSWGVLQIGILAAVRAQAEAEAREAKEKQRSTLRVWSSMKRTLRSMGFLETEKDLAVRHEAAIKIQRAWRNHVRFEATPSNDGGSLPGDLAIDNETRQASSRSSRSYPLDRVLWTRSALRNFAQLNGRGGGRLDRNEIRASMFRSSSERGAPMGSRFQSQAGKGRESQVGSDMRELTGQRVAMGVLLALAVTLLFTYTESNTTRPTTMVILHEQTMADEPYKMDALYSARNTSVPDLFEFQPADGEPIYLSWDGKNELRDREKLRVRVTDYQGQTSVGWFAVRYECVQAAWTEIVATIFIILVWFFGVTAFAGPVMSLVVVPIERMVRLLGMLMLDPLGYQSTARFKKFLIEEDALIKNTRWTKEVLKGMETSFLMSTILRIGSLMKVGFGSAGVEIIRNNLQKGQSKNMLILNSQGSTVSCIFLFSDIRRFTDATECLQEEVFVFTNRIAAVVHSICHSYGGAANKNVGDAFLLSWSLEDPDAARMNSGSRSRESSGAPLKAKTNQADKALLSVIKICISLHFEKYYLEPLSEAARNRLKSKLKSRPGPVVQMGFGLHAGKAVQGAIGSQRKIDATYVSEAVERAEFLESETKTYKVNMLMSGNFHRLLHPNTRRRCRKVDQIFIQDEEEDVEDDYGEELRGETMDLFTFDMDVDSIHRPQGRKGPDSDAVSDAGSIGGDSERRGGASGGGTTGRSKRMDRRTQGSNRQMRSRRRSIGRPMAIVNGSEELMANGPSSMNVMQSGGGNGNNNNNHNSTLGIGGGGPGGPGGNPLGSPSAGAPSVGSAHSGEDSTNPNGGQGTGPTELVLPTGPALYSHNVWQSPDMRRIRDKFVQSLFFQKFNAGLQAFYGRDWELARQCFQTVLDNFDDGPSKYFMAQITKHKGVPPHDFVEYRLA